MKQAHKSTATPVAEQAAAPGPQLLDPRVLAQIVGGSPKGTWVSPKGTWGSPKGTWGSPKGTWGSPKGTW